jgi:hypothetical protein
MGSLAEILRITQAVIADEEQDCLFLIGPHGELVRVAQDDNYIYVFEEEVPEC